MLEVSRLYVLGVEWLIKVNLSVESVNNESITTALLQFKQ